MARHWEEGRNMATKIVLAVLFAGLLLVPVLNLKLVNHEPIAFQSHNDYP
jgi:hypothetical protein